MRPCSRLDPALMLHAHGHVGGYARVWLEGHLEACGSCRDRWARCVVERETLRRSLSLGPGLEPEAAALMGRVAARVRSESPRGEYVPDYRPFRALFRRIRALLPLAGFCLVLLGVSAMVSAMAAFWSGPGSVGLATPSSLAGHPGVHRCSVCGLEHGSAIDEVPHRTE